MAKTYLTTVSNGTRDAECLQADTDCCSSLGSLAAVLLDRNGSTNGVCPLCIFEADRLNAFDQLIYINAGSLCDLLALFDGRNAILFQTSKDLRLSSFI